VVAENHHPRAICTIAPQFANLTIAAHAAHRIEIIRTYELHQFPATFGIPIASSKVSIEIETQISGGPKMRYLQYLKVLPLLGALLLLAPYAHAQRVVVGVGVGPGYYGAAPVCEYGYYGYAPYACAPYGYYGPSWFSGGVFIGAGPWFHGRGFYGGSGFYGRGGYGGGYYGRGGYVGRGGYGYAGRGGYAGGGYARGYAGGGYRGGAGGYARGGGGYARGGGGGSFHGGGASHGGGGGHGGHR
jgi:hypothetical protein